MRDDDSMTFTFRRVGTEGCEIFGPTGEVVAWTIDGAWARYFTGLANLVEWTSPPLTENIGD